MNVKPVHNSRFSGSTCEVLDVAPTEFTHAAKLLEAIVGKALVAHNTKGTDAGTFAFTGRIPAAYNPREEAYFSYEFFREQGSDGTYTVIVQGPQQIVETFHSRLTQSTNETVAQSRNMNFST